jgi:hypothetical protein
MKKSDWTMIIFVAIVTGFVSFMITNSLMGEERKPAESVKTTIVFSDRVDQPSQFVFRVDDSSTGSAINPTVPITTGSGTPGNNSNEDCATTLRNAIQLAELIASNGTANFDDVKTREEALKKVDSDAETRNNEVKNCKSLSADEQTDLQTRWKSIAEKSKQLIEEHFKNDTI